jgi:hypothetical protein
MRIKKLYKRKASRHTSYVYRWDSLTVKDLRELKKIKRRIIGCLGVMKNCQNASKSWLQACTFNLVRAYCHKTYSLRTRKSNRKRHSKRFSDISDTDCWIRFRTRKRDLPRLLLAFGLTNEYYYTPNKCKFSNEELLLIGLHKYCCPGNAHVTMASFFGREYSQLSRAFTLFNTLLIENCAYLVTDNLDYWVPTLPMFAEKVRLKLSEKGEIEYPQGSFRVAMFHDETVIGICRPGGGPRTQGKNAARHHKLIQQSFYNGWKKHHGYKYQTVEFPNGLAGDVFGPQSFRCNDLELLANSHLNSRLAAVQHGNEEQYCSYGDGIFPIDTHTKGKHVGDTSPLQRYENRMMTKIRIANEWSYGVTANLYPFVKYRYAQKLLKNSMTTKYYLVATILRNAHCCLYEGLVSSYFDCPSPELEHYFRV